MWGIIPAAGNGSRIQPLAFSKELLPVGHRVDEHGQERPRAVSEYLVERMAMAGAAKIAFVIAPGKSDIVQYYGGRYGDVAIVYAVQDAARGLCDAIFSALPMIPRDEPVLVGLPDTIWFPADGFSELPDDRLGFLLFPVARPELFDAVVCDARGTIEEIEVKRIGARSNWVWGAIKFPAGGLHALHALWQARGCVDEYLGTLVNAYIGGGGRAVGVRAGVSYVDVGTMHGWREALASIGGDGAPTSHEVAA